jgi:hypothetical protein
VYDEERVPRGVGAAAEDRADEVEGRNISSGSTRADDAHGRVVLAFASVGHYQLAPHYTFAAYWRRGAGL